MNIIGISCYYHDSAACLIQDGKVIAATQEERFTRVKYSSDFPINAVNSCLAQSGMTVYDIDHIVFYEKPYLKFSRMLIDHIRSFPLSLRRFMQTMPQWLDDRLTLQLSLKNNINFDGGIFFIKHHLSHAAAAFLPSSFERAAIITADGVGEWATTTLSSGTGNNIDIIKEIIYPDSLGLLYTAVTTYLGFRPLSGEGKVMGLAAHGEPEYLNKFNEIVSIKSDGSYKLDNSYFGFNKGTRIYSKKWLKTFGAAREAGSQITARDCNMAATLQKFTENILLQIARYIHGLANTDNLCLAGGLFLNCVANTRILEETPFKKVFIQPAAGDSGGGMGAALYLYNSLLGNDRNFVLDNVYLGPEFSSNYINRRLHQKNISYRTFPTEREFLKFIAKEIYNEKIVGWFQGRMEFGPRALGNRSILANPRNPDMKNILNNKVKKREAFRPYAPVVTLDKASDYFEMDYPSPFMLLAPRVRPDKMNIIPAVTHCDATARVQTVTESSNGILWKLLKEFELISGVPVLLNTSFNLKDEPIVCSPEDAIDSFNRSNMDLLVLGNIIISQD
jgi:carbamoyltransferase